MLKLLEAPVIVLGHLTDAQRRALVIADNQLALGAGWDEEMLRLELRILQPEDFDLDLIGFGESELAELLANDGDYTGHADEDAVPTGLLIEWPSNPATDRSQRTSMFAARVTGA
jgi:ParB-like chromosome segregation protein Spo0J